MPSKSHVWNKTLKNDLLHLLLILDICYSTLKNASFIDCTFLWSRAFSFLMIAKNGSESLLTSWLVSWKSILGAKIDSAVWMCLILKACSGLQWFETRYHFSYRVAKRTWKQSDFSTQKECISQGCNGFVSEAEDGSVHYLKSFQEKNDVAEWTNI